MHEFNSLQKKATDTAAQMKAMPGSNAVYLQDNRPQRAVHQLMQRPSATTPPGTVAQLARTGKTISGHGNLRRGGKKKDIMKYKVPKGKTIMRPAPPGATLGNLSMLLNEKKGLSRTQLLKLMKVSTTSDLWKNKHVITIVKNNTKIPKTATQEKALDKLLNGKTITGPEKGSLTKLESKDEFEKWVDSYVRSETFKTFKGGEMIEDMEFTKFEPKLKSSNSHSENDYISSPETLSGYVNSNMGTDDFVINACSFDEKSPFCGFQIDHKKDK